MTLKLTENGLYNDPKLEPYLFKPTISINDCSPGSKPGDAYSENQQNVCEETRDYKDNPRTSRQAAYTLTYEMIWSFNA